MKEIAIHPWPLLAAAVLRFVIGAFWYSPAGFGKPWQRLVGANDIDMKRDLPKAMLTDLLANVILVFVLLHAVVYAGANTWPQGAAVGFFNWLGFIAMPMLALVFWEHRPWKLYGIGVACNLVSMVAAGALLAVWN